MAGTERLTDSQEVASAGSSAYSRIGRDSVLGIEVRKGCKPAQCLESWRQGHLVGLLRSYLQIGWM